MKRFVLIDEECQGPFRRPTTVDTDRTRRSLQGIVIAVTVLLGLNSSLPIRAASDPTPPASSNGSPNGAAGSGSTVSAFTGETASLTYKLGADDLLSLKIARHPELDTAALVLADGTITLPRIGSVNVDGKTLIEAQNLLRQKYMEVFVNPEVTLAIKTPRVQQVQVFGAVNLPGPVEYKEGWRVTEALAKAGGLKVRPSWVRTTLSHNGGGTQSIDLESLLRKPEGPSNVFVQPGDVLIVSELPPQQIFVGGQVAKPGMYDLRDVDAKRGAIGVLEAVALAGGGTPKAALSQAYILRADHSGASATNGTTPAGAGGRRSEPIDLSRIQRADTPWDTGVTPPEGASPSTPGPPSGSGGSLTASDPASSTVLSSSMGAPPSTASPTESKTPDPFQPSGPSQSPNTLESSSPGGSSSAGSSPAIASSTPTAPSGTPNSPLSDVLLYPGDTLQIPESTAQIVVLEHVLKPGAFPIPEDRPTTLAMALALAGGPDARGRMSQVGVVRLEDPSQGLVPGAKPKLLTADMTALVTKKDFSQNIELKPGDVVYVAETKKPDWFGKVIPALSTATSLLFYAGVTF